jgi:hypothetical protein
MHYVGRIGSKIINTSAALIAVVRKIWLGLMNSSHGARPRTDDLRIPALAMSEIQRIADSTRTRPDVPEVP